MGCDVLVYANVWNQENKHMQNLIGHRRLWKRVYDIGVKADEIFLVDMWYKQQINQSCKSIDLQLYK
jgi:hypothetical protein